MAEPAASQIIRFGGFQVDLRAGELRKHGTRLKLSGQPFRILALLLEHPGEVVSREELRAELWPADTFVDFDHGLHAAINKLRETLGDSAEQPRFIETLPRRGYRFIAAIDGLAPPSAPAAAESQVVPSAAPAQRVSRLAMIVGVFVVVIGASYLAWRQFSPRAQPPAGKIMLAVLPFENLSGDPEQEYFSDGLTEEMTTQLGRLDPERLVVIARSSVMGYKHGDRKLDQLSRALGVQYVLEGSVRRDANRVRITAQLIQVKNQSHVWAESYDRDLRDILALQNDVAGAIARHIKVKLTPKMSANLGATRMINLEAYELYLKGRYFWNRRSEEGYKKAIEYFEQAIAREPDYAQAYAGLADAYALLGSAPNFELARRKAMPRARAAALKALALDDSLAEAHTSLAFVRMHYDWDWLAAENEFNRALALNPAYPTAHHWYAYFLMARGRNEEALREIRFAQQSDPFSLIINTDVGEMLFYAGRYDEAIQQARTTLGMDARFAPAHHILSLAYLAKQQYAQAIAELETAARLPGGRPDFAASLGVAYAQAGQRKEALRVLGQLKDESQQRPDMSYSVASVLAALGERDESLAWLEKAYQGRDGSLILLTVAPWFDSLHSDPQFADLVRRVGLPTTE